MNQFDFLNNKFVTVITFGMPDGYFLVSDKVLHDGKDLSKIIFRDNVFKPMDGSDLRINFEELNRDYISYCLGIL